ncbi:MAG: hypothetical protein SCH71_13365 [Desulfobulbaceae bacterium]|nr:hypothetical protein [Desulfobulbaceae bacterium]
MEKQQQVNIEHLYRLARSGKSAQEIMQELNINDMAALETAWEKMMREKKEDIRIPGLVGSSSINPRYTDKGIRIDPEMLSGYGFRAGDQFRLSVEGDKITLKRQT